MSNNIVNYVGIGCMVALTLGFLALMGVLAYSGYKLFKDDL